jgi:D-sedoheptulose 7-phosphate isomerase
LKLVDSIKRAKRVYLIGNGGSFANAAHIANDLLSVGVRAYTLDAATLTAFANDYGYENAFARWIGIVGERGDLLIALSGSGKSENIIEAIAAAQGVGMKTMLVTRYLRGVDMQQSEEEQLKVGHEVMKELRAGL